jgi:hypothetical protein
MSRRGSTRPKSDTARSTQSQPGSRPPSTPAAPAPAKTAPLHLKWLLAAIAVVLAARLAAFRHWSIATDDACITFHGCIDPLWRVATTSPVWSILLSAGDPFIASRLYALVADVVALCAARQVLSAPGFLAFASFWASPLMCYSASSGLETHLVAAAFVLARAWPGGLGLAAALRPDAALLALVAAGKRWKWALAGAAVFLISTRLWGGHWIPQTVASKAAVYGIRPGAWIWLTPPGIGWLTALLLPVALRYEGMRWYAAAAALFLLGHVVLGTPLFWWYAIPPAAMLAIAAAGAVRDFRGLIAGVALVVAFAPGQFAFANLKSGQDRELWQLGSQISQHFPPCRILLEPAGIIPYLNPAFSCVDDVGLIDPWMAKCSAEGAGWRTRAIEHYQPDLLVVRQREYLFPDTWKMAKNPPYRDSEEAKLAGYQLLPLGSVTGKEGTFQTKLKSDGLLLLRKMLPGEPALPPPSIQLPKP